MQRITPNLWFDTEAEDAAKFYTSLFPNSGITDVSHWGEGGLRPAGTVLTVAFEIDGQRFTALNGGPQFEFNEAISFALELETQEEVDDLWDKLLAGGGEEGACGWVKDRFGLWWQVIPSALPRLLQDEDSERAGRVMQAMLQMKKIDVATLENA
jgi:predicted 3-demethylubiquinone-9 3-methyltransferase (glyoxalase superfamily)